MELRKLFGVTFYILTTAPAAELMPNVLLAFLWIISEAERGILTIGHTRISLFLAQACVAALSPWRGHSSVASHSATAQHERQQLPVISPIKCAYETGATGCLRRWEGSSYPIDRLPPASSWAAPVSKVPIRHGLPASTGVWSLQRQLNKRIDKLPPGKQKNAKKMPALRIASWNVRTMRPGLSNDLQQINDSRKTAIIDSELDRLNIDITTLQETRLAENGSLKEQRYTFFWQGKGIEEKREHGVGFAVKNSLLTVTEPPVNGSARILAIRLSTRAGHANIMSVYAPTLCSTADSKDQFYEELDVAIGNIPKTEQLYILGDFNARV